MSVKLPLKIFLFTERTINYSLVNNLLQAVRNFLPLLYVTGSRISLGMSETVLRIRNRGCDAVQEGTKRSSAERETSIASSNVPFFIKRSAEFMFYSYV